MRSKVVTPEIASAKLRQDYKERSPPRITEPVRAINSKQTADDRRINQKVQSRNFRQLAPHLLTSPPNEVKTETLVTPKSKDMTFFTNLES